MNATPRRLSLLVLSSLTAACAAPVEPPPDLTGMWSDPPATALDMLCFFACTDASLERMRALLDDPANDSRPYSELSAEAVKYETDEYIRPHLTDAALATSPLDPLADRGYLYCEPWGFASQVFAPHQLEIRQFADRVEMHYGEWDARRTVLLDARASSQDQPHAPLGYSVGHYEGDTLVIETTAITANDANWNARHSDRLTAVERYRRPSRERLELTATMSDPWSLRQPIVFKKVWSFAPDQEIFAYDACEPAATQAPAGDPP